MNRNVNRTWRVMSFPTLLGVILGVVMLLSGSGAEPSGAGARTVGAPPPSAGWFRTKPVGSWSTLPGGPRCADRVHRSSWEPRPDNAGPNHRMPARDRVRSAFAARPVALENAYHPRWDTWLLPRVSGRFTGTTDEIFQWAACKWGIADNVLRALAVRESTWYQYDVYADGSCVEHYSCGDLLTSRNEDTDVFCQELASYGRDYQDDYGPGLCPRTFGITGVMSWQAPAWGVMPGNQNGTFPFNRQSTAFAVDYVASQLRGCLEGWQTWLGNTGTGAYRAGALWGCVGAWYAGEWNSAEAVGYIDRVRAELRARTWLTEEFRLFRPACDPVRGCAQGS